MEEKVNRVHIKRKENSADALVLLYLIFMSLFWPKVANQQKNFPSNNHLSYIDNIFHNVATSLVQLFRNKVNKIMVSIFVVGTHYPLGLRMHQLVQTPHSLGLRGSKS